MNTINIALYGFDERSRSRMETIFLINFKNKCAVASAETAHIHIVDAEGIHSNLAEFLSHFPKLHTLVLLPNSLQLADFKTICKPAKLNELWEGIVHALSGLPAAASLLLDLDAPQSSLARSVTEQVKTDHKDDVNEKIRSIGSQTTFHPEDYFVHFFAAEIQKARQAHATSLHIVCWNGGHIYVIPEHNIVFTNISKNRLRALAASPFVDTYRKATQCTLLGAIPSETTLRDMHSMSIEACLWELAYLTSRGRIPHSLDLNKALTLDRWPNLTRLPYMPNGMRITALWVGNAQKLNDIAERLGIDKAEVYSFYFAASTLGLSHYAQRQSDHLVNTKSEAKANSGFILSAILKHVGKSFRHKAEDSLSVH